MAAMKFRLGFPELLIIFTTFLFIFARQSINTIIDYLNEVLNELAAVVNRLREMETPLVTAVFAMFPYGDLLDRSCRHHPDIH